MQWDKESVVQELRRRSRKGEDLSFTALRGSGVWGAAIRYFGSYRTAVETAGIPYEQVWRRRLTKWDQKRVIRELKGLHRAKEDIHSRSLRRTNAPLHSAATHWFGSYRKAVEAAGMDYDRVSRQPAHRWSKELIVRELRRLKREGKPLHYAAVEREMPSLAVAAHRYFGSYGKAVQAAGIDYKKVMRRQPRPRRPAAGARKA